MIKLTVAKALIQFLEKAGVEYAFGYNGHGNWALCDAVEHESKIHGIKANAEDTAVHMADLFWRMRRKGPLPIVLTTVGPGNMNICPALANAFYESSAMLILAGAGPSQWIDRGGFEECYRYTSEEFTQVIKPICKKAVLVIRPDTALDVVVRAYKEALSGRPGPVVVQIPFDIQHTEIEIDEIPCAELWTTIHRPGPDPSAIEKAAVIISKAQRPILLTGSGIFNSGASKALIELAETYQIPVGTIFSGKGAIPETHPLSLGCIDAAGSRLGFQAAANCDVVIAIGARFTDFNSCAWTMYKIPKRTKLIQIDIDPGEISRNFPAEVAITSDARMALEALSDAFAKVKIKPSTFESWRKQLEVWRADWVKEKQENIGKAGSAMSYARFLDDASKVVQEVDPETSIVMDTGNLCISGPGYFTATSPNFATDNQHFARMGWGCGGVLGAKLANPEHPALALIGDGSFLMTGLAISTAVEHSIPAVWVILNNRTICIETEAMKAIYFRSAFCDMKIHKTGAEYRPDYVKMVEALGVKGRKVASSDDFRLALKQALLANEPFVLDVEVDPLDKGYYLDLLPLPIDWHRKTLDPAIIEMFKLHVVK